MARVTSVSAPLRSLVPERAASRSLIRSVVLPAATVVVLLAGALLAVLSPHWVNTAIDLAGSPAILGVPAADTHRISEATVAELLFGPGTFAVTGPDGGRFFDESEAAHLRDARLVLFLFLGIAAASLGLVVTVLLRRPRAIAAWRSLARGGAALAVIVAALGVIALVAFEPAFELFHRIFFPGGNWAFDPSTQRLVQLYPLPFWQLTTAAIGVIAALLGALVWWSARRRARGLEAALEVPESEARR